MKTALNPSDARHTTAMNWFNASRQALITTEWILTELADGLGAVRNRAAVVELERRLRADERVEIVAGSPALFAQAFELYADRPDKNWSLTDCVSFVVMQEKGINDALTGDHHFEQAGFKALLK